MKRKLIIHEPEEVLEREIKSYDKSTSAFVILPKKHQGKNAVVIIGGEKE